jgi:hypothetical protein
MQILVLLLGIFRRAQCHQAVPLCPFTSQGAPCPLNKFMIRAPSGSHLRCLKCVKTYGKTFYWVSIIPPWCEQPENLSDKFLKFGKNKDTYNVHYTLLYKPLICKIQCQKQPITVPDLLVIAVGRMISNLINNTHTFFSSSVIQLIASSSVCHTHVVSWKTVKPLSIPDKDWQHSLIFGNDVASVVVH